MMRQLLILLCFIPFAGQTQDAKTNRLQQLLDSFCTTGQYPGLSFALAADQNRIITLASGYADRERKITLQPTGALMQGSVGKTYVSALVLDLVQQQKLRLEDKVSVHLGQYDWFHRLPNAKDITVKMLLNHTSGIMRYEFKEAFTKDLTADPGKTWQPEELLAYVFDEKAPFPAGEGWDYSDTNYILLGMILEKLTGMKYYDLLQKNLLDPYGLRSTFPTQGRKLDRLVPGYAGPDNEFGGKDKVIDEKGLFIINPQFEWTGGGLYSTPEDLARWGKLLYEGKVVDTALLFSQAVPAKLGRNTQYAMGVIIRQTGLGKAVGHSGFFPGYMTEMLYFPEHKICVALQSNSSDFKTLKVGLLRILMELAAAYRNDQGL